MNPVRKLVKSPFLQNQQHIIKGLFKSERIASNFLTG